MTFVMRNLKTIVILFFIYLSFNSYSNAHTKGKFTSDKEALKMSKELGCKGIHKKKDKWLPCQNEKELHKYLR